MTGRKSRADQWRRRLDKAKGLLQKRRVDHLKKWRWREKFQY